ncbi:MFS transporter [Ventosimonas gracilis]|uniref:MFS transporter n=2 Tax=Ventosimonas gracilis TaxID=1680762 RepID=A0A139SJX4_9GAMM|nr:MFS transporter [Ventosimonas gracilis]
MQQAMIYLQRTFKVEPQELPQVLWSLLYVLALFLAWYLLRPIRDEMGIAGGVRNLPWLFTATLIATLALSPLFALAVRRLSRQRFIALSYRFFAANLLLFALFLQFAANSWQLWLGRVFFIWSSVFNLFVISLFWSLMVDVFSGEQGKRLFGLLAAGATTGGILGAYTVSQWVELLDRSGVLLMAIVFLEIALLAAQRVLALSRKNSAKAINKTSEPPIGGGVLSAFSHCMRSPYLIGIALFMLLYSVTSTFLYYQQASIIELNFVERAERTAFLAKMDLWSNGLTLLLQLFVSSRLLSAGGMVLTLIILPLVSLAGFAALTHNPNLITLMVAQVARRVSNYAFAKPAREVLFTAVSREDRYKAKNVIDTVVYRAGDQVGSWSYAALIALGLTLAQIPLVAVLLSVLWLGLSIWLGRRHAKAQ